MDHPFRITGVLVALALTTSACGTSPTSPSARGAISLTKLEIVGSDLMESGRTQQLTAQGVYSDGTTRDLTREVTWTLGELGRLAISGTGFVTAGPQRGDYTVIATHGKHGDSTRVQATRLVHVIPVGTYRFSGVLMNGGVPFGGMPIELVNEHLHAATVTTPDGGFVFYGVAGDAEIHVAREGFLREVRRLRVADHSTHTIDIALTPVLDGRYTLRIAAAAECSAQLPAGARERTLQVLVTQRGIDLIIQVHVPSGEGPTSFSGSAQPGHVVFTLPPHRTRPAFVPPPLFDRFAVTPEVEMFVATVGSATVRPVSGGAAGTLDGSLEVWTTAVWWETEQDFARPAICRSTAHQFVLSK